MAKAAKNSNGSGNGYSEKKPLALRIKEGEAKRLKSIEYTLVETPYGAIEIRPPTVLAYRQLRKFEAEGGSEVDPTRAAMGIALFMCFDPDTNKLVWKDTPGNRAWIEGQPLSWLNNLAAQGAVAMESGLDIETAGKNLEPTS